jgi:hypothetical protein
MFYTSPINSSDATFRIWGKALSDAMTAVGFGKTADTGQIDWATIATPISVSTMAGYEIRAFSDALQATNPVIVKIEYGCGAATATPAVQLTVGRATDGAGNFIGEISSVIAAIAYSSSASLFPCYVSGSSDRISVVITATHASYCFAFWIERAKDDTGANTDIGVDIGVKSYVSSQRISQVFFPKDGLQFPYAPTYGVPCLVPYSGSFSYDGNLGIFPVYTYCGYVANPNLALCIYNTASIGYGSIISLTIFGATHKYILTNCPGGSINGNTASTLCIALRYE